MQWINKMFLIEINTVCNYKLRFQVTESSSNQLCCCLLCTADGTIFLIVSVNNKSSGIQLRNSFIEIIRTEAKRSEQETTI